MRTIEKFASSGSCSQEIGRNARLAGIAGVLLLAGNAMASTYSFPVFNATPVTGAQWRNTDLLTLAGGSIPTNNYVGFTVEADWTSGGAFSSHSVMRPTSFPFAANTNPSGSGVGTRYSTSSIGASNATANDSSVNSLTFRSIFQDFSTGLPSSYAGGSNPFFLNYRNTINSPSEMSNVRVTLYDNYDEMLNVTDLGTVGAGTTTLTIPYTRSGNVQWFKFKVGQSMGAGDFLTVDTIDNTLDGLARGFGDTELFFAGFNGISAGGGNENDNFILNGTPTNASALAFGDTSASILAGSSNFGSPGDLLNGDTYYYFAVSAYDSSRLSGPGAANFNMTGAVDQAVPGVDPTGNFVVNINTNVIPSPGALALLGLGGLTIARRRR